MRRADSWITRFVVACSLLWMPSVFAFNGKEHRAVSNDALALVLARSGTAHPLYAYASSLSGPRTFGDLTAMVDWYQNPDRFAESCDWNGIEGRNAPVFSFEKLKHLVAIHHNDDHFQDGAVAAYRDTHEMAIRAAADQPEKALWLEAFAVHYLHDFLAPGHIVSPRARSDDTVAATLHDVHNAIGATVRSVLPDGLGDLEAGDSLRADLEALRAREARSMRFLGDDQLEGDQYEVLVMVTAISLLDVFDAALGAGGMPSLGLCYRSRSAKRREGWESSQPLEGSYRGPFAAVLDARAYAMGYDQVCDCSKAALVEFEFSEQEVLREPYFTPRVWRVGSLHSFGGRNVFDFGWTVTSYEPSRVLRVQEDASECSEETFKGGVGAGSFHYTLTRGPGYRADGVHLELAWPTRYVTINTYAGPKRYEYGERSDYRLDGGVSVVAGLEVVNVSLALELGRQPDSSGRLRPRAFFMAGWNLNVASPWVKTGLQKTWAAIRSRTGREMPPAVTPSLIRNNP